MIVEDVSILLVLGMIIGHGSCNIKQDGTMQYLIPTCIEAKIINATNLLFPFATYSNLYDKLQYYFY